MATILVDDDISGLDAVLEKLYREGGYDFRDYKRGTIIRRLARRLHATGAATYAEYVRFLDGHPEEYQTLAEDITIKVSGFFRSLASFRQLSGLVLPELVRDMPGGALRFWSVACSRGEEPYSMAMSVSDFLGQRRREYDIAIRATDISRWALDKARAGLYSPADLEHLPEAVLRNHFTACGDDYEVNSDIKRMVDYSRFDLTSTTRPPFTGIHCIFCCNILIYWQRQLQRRVLRMLYEALAVPGYLFLGEAETVPQDMEDSLVCLDIKAKIYKKIAD